MYHEVRRNGRLLFKYDPHRRLIEIKRGPELYTIDIEQLNQELTNEEPEPHTRCNPGGRAPHME